MCNKQTPISIKYAWRHRNGQSRLIGLKMVLVVFQHDLRLLTWLISPNSNNELQTLDSKQIKNSSYRSIRNLPRINARYY